MNWKLLALGKGFEEKKNWRDVAVPERVQLCFELSMHFPVFFSRKLFLVAVHGWFAIQTNVWRIQSTTGRFLAQLNPSNFFSSNPFPSAKSFQFMNFSEAMFYENYLTSDFHTNTAISSLFAYSSKWRRKP